jgi:hypothetical protein
MFVEKSPSTARDATDIELAACWFARALSAMLIPVAGHSIVSFNVVAARVIIHNLFLRLIAVFMAKSMTLNLPKTKSASNVARDSL